MTSHVSNVRKRRGRALRLLETIGTGGETLEVWGALTGLLANLLLLYLLYIGFVFLVDVFWILPAGLFDRGLLGEGLNVLRFYGLVPVLGLLTLALSGSLAVRRVVESVNHTRSLWVDACPKCGGANLRRIHRKPLERLASRLGIRVRRYSCKDCRWRGPRIAVE